MSCENIMTIKVNINIHLNNVFQPQPGEDI